MKRLEEEAGPHDGHWVPRKRYKEIVRTSFSAPATFSNGEDDRRVANCVNCTQHRCVVFSNEEMCGVCKSRSVCPVEAISIIPEKIRADITPNCVGCGLCILRCPMGAIYYDWNRKAIVSSPEDLECVNSERYREYVSGMSIMPKIPNPGKDSFISTVMENLKDADKDVFYPYIARLFCSIGLPCIETRAGDTNDRIDAKLIGPFGIIPIEIKSPSESSKPMVKAVQQALENKIIALSRHLSPPTPRPVTSLVVGYEKLAARSEIHELIEDIYRTYGFNIGVISLSYLLEVQFRMYYGEKVRVESLISFRGSL